jgi:hypothetical protein
MALPACAVNFAWVQTTLSTGTATHSEAFTSNNTAGNAIIVVTYATAPGAGIPSDTQGNTYNIVQLQVFNNIAIYAALNIHAGANTITTTGGNGFVAAEYSSINPTYYVCPGSSDTISSSGAGFSGGGSVTFTSPSEVMAVFGGNITASGGSWHLATGNLRFNGVDSAAFGGNGAMLGDENVASVPPTYTNTALYNTSTAGARIAAFLTLVNSCSALAAAPSVFAIIY